MLTIKDLVYIESVATKNFTTHPPRAILKDEGRPLTEAEQRILATFEASVSFLRSKGLVDDEALEYMPRWQD